MYVTRTPPSASVVGGPSKGAASPSTVIFSFASHVLNGTLGAPVVAAQCLLQPMTDAQQQVPSPMLFMRSRLPSMYASTQTLSVSIHAGQWRRGTAHRCTAGCHESEMSRHAPQVASAGGAGNASAGDATVQLQSLALSSPAAWANCTSPVTFTVRPSSGQLHSSPLLCTCS